MQPTITCPRSNRAGRYLFITPASSWRVSTAIRQTGSHKSSVGDTCQAPVNFLVQTDEAILAPHVLQVDAVLIDDRLDSVHHRRRNGFSVDSRIWRTCRYFPKMIVFQLAGQT